MYEGLSVRSAILCERVLQERDGVYSAIRVLERLTLVGPRPASGVLPPAQARAQLLLTLVAGASAPGARALLLSTRAPSGQVLGKRWIEVQVEPGPAERTLNLVLDVTLDIHEDGPYWLCFAVDREDQIVCRTPLWVERRFAGEELRS